MEDVIVSFTWRTSPDMCQGETQLLHIVQVAEKDLVIHGRSEVSGLEEVNRVQVGDVDAPGVRGGGVRAILLDVHAKETGIDAVDLLERKHRTGTEREVVIHLAGVNVSAGK